MAPLLLTIISAILLQWNVTPTVAFQVPIPITCQKQQRHHRCGSIVLRDSNNGGDNAAAAEAKQLLAKAKAIRDSLPATTEESGTKTISSIPVPERKILSDFALQSQSLDNSYRLYLDIGREPGTWMDPRWGASGRRIECTIDVSFVKQMEDGDIISPEPENGIISGLKKTVTSKSSSLSQVYKLQSAPYIRLRRGFDKMAISDGGYCTESPANPSISASSTLRFCLSVDGTTDGDVTIPGGNLYFALPYFGLLGTDSNDSTPQMNLSTKEGTVTVKQVGWHTGWRREESRILGVFRAVPLEKAQARDKF
eukprot:CAMPEP_0172308678 /NCGR_PEP_ID=MMETSP1058-20130122/9203_1 /TAXON_ID=83371 /ORGANISM="Detonula confervacea, Strain CCMP 353" /LENGTH=309 /DNA_ID=CAMNT_0013021151 /DNA_START=60 /DNA_END=989 /DNA_ORIENTATION=+